ncbi:hypothetical protein [Marinobacter sp.]|uniref:hypothetical protein n=1 Tax=Marinobacter sp. TaxID=50741 RepID=UPI002619D4BA|nr:hypothetical protein [Marinobacter sp.]
MERELSIKSKDFFLVFILPFVFGVSYSLLELYTGGDQVYYSKFYIQVQELAFSQAMLLAPNSLGSGEPVSIFILWLGSYLGFDKSIYISVLNSLLAFFFVKFSNKEGVPFFITLLLIFNFYFIVLFTGAERLKIAYVFLCSALFFKGYSRNLLFVISCLSHLQIFLLLPSFLIYSNYSFLFRLFKYQYLNKKFLMISVAVASFSLITFFYLNDVLISKVNAYLNFERSPWQLVQLSLLSIVGVFSSSNYKRVLFSLLPFFVFVLLLGGGRVNMLAVTFVIGALIIENKISKPLPVLLLTYFLLKSFPFIQNIIEKGNGFA